jgi:hypothetical protein
MDRSASVDELDGVLVYAGAARWFAWAEAGGVTVVDARDVQPTGGQAQDKANVSRVIGRRPRVGACNGGSWFWDLRHCAPR